MDSTENEKKLAKAVGILSRQSAEPFCFKSGYERDSRTCDECIHRLVCRLVKEICGDS